MDVKVSRLTSYLTNIFNTDPILMNIGVIGEISNLKYHGSGSIFFTLKDEKASIRCQIWRRQAERLRYRLEDGMEVKASGRVSIYEKGGTYSLIANDVEVSGEGALMAAYRSLYKKLEAEGLFLRENKKPIPSFPKKICLMTSDTGAALRDMMKIIRSRNRKVDILVYPVLVQGPGAAGQIAAGIRDVNARFTDVDVIIAGRGGGSLEDLWAFNEEPVARAMYESVIPVISAVGHETDFTIADFAADVRAETPTAAAVMAAPDLAALREKTEDLFRNGVRERLHRMYRDRQNAVARFSPEQMILSLKNRYFLKSESLKRFEPEVLGRTLQSKMERYAAETELLAAELQRSVKERLKERAEELERTKIMLDAADPERLVRRGYAIITDEQGNAVTGTASLQQGQALTIRLADGSVLTEIKEIRENSNERE